jgi:hypothetical protein
MTSFTYFIFAAVSWQSKLIFRLIYLLPSPSLCSNFPRIQLIAVTAEHGRVSA